jgi:hypothetical protein
MDGTINVPVGHKLKAYYGMDDNFISPHPYFTITETARNEKTNELTINAADAVYDASNHTIAELAIMPPYTIKEFAAAAAAVLGVQLREPTDEIFELSYAEGANFNSNETIRTALNGIAEISQTIYYIDSDNYLVFKSLKGQEVALTIDKMKYFELSSEPIKQLRGLAHITQLGDNVAAVIPDAEGDIHYIRDNPFLELREDVGSILESRLAYINGLTISPFSCDWCGNFLLEPGDKIALQTKDDSLIYSFLLDDKILFNGGYKQVSQWVYESSENAHTNPTTLGDKLNETFAKVDKVNQQINLVVRSVEDTENKIAELSLDIDGVYATVEQSQKETKETLKNVNGEIVELTQRVDAAITAEAVSFQIQQELNKGVDKVITATGYVFDDEGLTVSKTGSEMTTTISDNGMTVYKNDEAVLNANNRGVDAKNLHATTYLIIGTNSRFEDYGSRTACFFIGG